MGYFEARRARFKRNNDALKKLADDVIKADPTIEAYHHKDKPNIESITFFKGEEICHIGFHEVPYGWSGCGYPEFPGEARHGGWVGQNVALPFTAEDVLKHFKPLGKHSHYNNKEGYLKWSSWLIKYNG